ELAIGAFGIITTFSTLIIMTIVGLTNGVQPIIGYNYGAKKYDRVLKTLKYACVVAISLTLTGSLCAQLFAKQIATLFTSDLQLINLTERGMRLAMMMFFVVGFQLIVTNFFQSIGQVKMAIFLSVSRQILFLMPFLLLLPKFFGLDGAWTAHCVADLLSALVAGTVLVVQIKKLKQSHIS
ncbi:MAG TPA: MATE family efflux transporter, partial [Paludibacteraceae bacterium]|nr:MATE family efflux transporter [Paludibacteraceae bacterium]